MRFYKNSILLGLVILFFYSCQKDSLSKNGSVYVETINLHLTYDKFGIDKAYSTPLKVRLTNVTEQLSSQYETDEMGKITLSKLLPGEYTFSVSGQLTKQEMIEMTGDPDASAANLSAFLSNLSFSVNEKPVLPAFSLIISNVSSLIFKELYYAGSKTPTGLTYRNDSFFSIVNNSDYPVSINNVYIASVENFGGLNIAGPLWPGEEQGKYKHIYAQAVWKIVAGDEPVNLEPGKSIVIATMGAPHNKSELYNLNSPVDLSNADYEAYINDPENRYTDFPVKNMKRIFWPNYSYLWRLGVFGQGMVLIEASPEEFATFEDITAPESIRDPFEDPEYWICKKIPLKYVMDAVDLIQNETATITKRFPPALDNGFATVGGVYLSKSVIRKSNNIDGVIRYQDTNNSTEDFVINDHPLSK